MIYDVLLTMYDVLHSRLSETWIYVLVYMCYVL